MDFKKLLKSSSVESASDLLPEPEAPSHEHEWISKAMTYAAPRKDAIQINVADTALLEKFVLGVTTILWECATCHETKKDEMLGSDRIQLDELLDKVNLHGPQYIQTDNGTFVLQRHTLPNQPTQGLPLR